MSEFTNDLESLLNCYSKENGSNTPDFILQEFLIDCLTAFDKATSRRSAWYGEGVEVHRPLLSNGDIHPEIEMCPRCWQVVSTKHENFCNICGTKVKENNSLTSVEPDTMGTQQDRSKCGAG